MTFTLDEVYNKINELQDITNHHHSSSQDESDRLIAIANFIEDIDYIRVAVDEARDKIEEQESEISKLENKIEELEADR